ncbi:unnamed protein product [Diplocarpon coronariae]
MVPLTPPKQQVLSKCSASSYGTFGIGLRATLSLTSSMGGKVGKGRKPGRLCFVC